MPREIRGLPAVAAATLCVLAGQAWPGEAGGTGYSAPVSSTTASLAAPAAAVSGTSTGQGEPRKDSSSEFRLPMPADAFVYRMSSTGMAGSSAVVKVAAPVSATIFGGVTSMTARLPEPGGRYRAAPTPPVVAPRPSPGMMVPARAAPEAPRPAAPAASSATALAEAKAAQAAAEASQARASREYNAAVSLYMKKDFDGAIARLRALLAEDDKRYVREDWRSNKLMGDCFLDKREYRDALAYYQRAREINPRDPYVNSQIGKLEAYLSRD